MEWYHSYYTNRQSMQEHTGSELYQAIEYTKSIDEDASRKIMEQFQFDQTALPETIFDIFPAVPVKENGDMSYLFMDLCCDILCIYQKAFGPLPSQMRWLRRLEKQAMLLDAELKTLVMDKHMDENIKARLCRIVCCNVRSMWPYKWDWFNFMNAAIDDFASEN